MLRAAICATADAAKIEDAIDAGDRVVVDADDVGQKRGRDGGEQAGHREPRERRETGDDEHRTHLDGHRQPLHTDAAGAL